MAATNKHAEIRAAKQAIRRQIEEAQAAIRSVASGALKIPDRIVNGSHQEAVRFKEEIRRINDGFSLGLRQPGRSLSLKKLTARLAAVEALKARVA